LQFPADHGNAEQMLTDGGEPLTSHTMYPVPLAIEDAKNGVKLIREGRGCLADVAPTVLAAMGIDKPAEMTGESFIAKAE
jgi:2,3-bisphosphoglycerate-independent phosphoglycerate mutase